MQALDAGGQLTERPAPLATVAPGYAQNNPSAPGGATTIDPDWANAGIAEDVYLLGTAGLTLSKTDVTQRSKAIQAGGLNYAADTGAVNAYAVTLTPPLAAMPPAGFLLRFSTVNPSTLASTMNAGGGAASILRHDGSKLRAGDIVAGLNTLESDGTDWRVPRPGRARLPANTTFYVNAGSGNDANDGLSTGTAWATLQNACNELATTYDLDGFNATIQLADGTYTTGGTASVPWVGGSAANVIVNGNSGTPTNVIISTTSASCFIATNGGGFTVQNLKMQTTTAGDCILCDAGTIILGPGIVFGVCAGVHVAALGIGAVCVLNDNYTISGGAHNHMIASNLADVAVVGGITVTLTGTPAFSVQFASAEDLGLIRIASVTFSGSATGTRYLASVNAAIDTNGAGASYLPGNAVGSTATGGQYV